ncbi:MAG: hypothetical protein JWO28_3340 [Hyphomicrobiales bacterium]|nr:hypothetical protein [Hyphomicrobiales bacterium]
MNDTTSEAFETESVAAIERDLRDSRRKRRAEDFLFHLEELMSVYRNTTNRLLKQRCSRLLGMSR